jgi:hypothetical protein
VDGGSAYKVIPVDQLQKEEVDLLDWLSDYGLEVTFE